MRYWSEYVSLAQMRFETLADGYDDPRELVAEIVEDVLDFLTIPEAAVEFLSANPEAFGWEAPPRRHESLEAYLQAAARRRLREDLDAHVADMEVKKIGGM